MQNPNLQDGQFRQMAVAQSNQNTPQVWADVQLITPAIAAKMIADYEYKGQRNFRPFLVTRLARQMVLARWKFSPIKLAHMDDKTFLVDGQHRLRAIVASGTSQMFCVMHSNCKNNFEVAEEYNSCGTVVGARTNTDSLRASGIADRLNIGSNAFSKLTAAVNIILTEFSPRPTRFLVARDDQEQAQVMEEYQEAMALYLDSIVGAGPAISKPLRWAGFLAAALIIFETDKQKADVFFRAFSHNPSQYPATRELELFILPLTGGKGGTSVSQLHIARAVASAWNRFYTKPLQPIRRFEIQDADAPIRVAGSSYYTGTQNVDPLALTFRGTNAEVNDGDA